jgi:small subunit ribosomal protein S6
LLRGRKRKEVFSLRIYETIYICPPNLNQEKIEEFSDMVHEVIYDFGGKIIKQECWGKKRLAYEVKHQKDGIYYYFLYGGEGKTVEELERRLQLADECLRYLTVRLDKELKGKKHKIFTQEELRLALQMEPPRKKEKKKRQPKAAEEKAETAAAAEESEATEAEESPVVAEVSAAVAEADPIPEDTAGLDEEKLEGEEEK